MRRCERAAHVFCVCSLTLICTCCTSDIHFVRLCLVFILDYMAHILYFLVGIVARVCLCAFVTAHCQLACASIALTSRTFILCFILSCIMNECRPQMLILIACSKCVGWRFCVRNTCRRLRKSALKMNSGAHIIAAQTNLFAHKIVYKYYVTQQSGATAISLRSPSILRLPFRFPRPPTNPTPFIIVIKIIMVVIMYIG